MSNIKRYSPTTIGDSDDRQFMGMFEFDDGKYCAYEDVDASLAAKDARIAELEKRMRPMPPSNFDLTDQEQFIRRRADEIFDENQADERADDYMYMNEKMCREAAAIEWGAMQALAAQQQAEPCQGTNCGTTTCQHSDECIAETAISQGWDKYATHSEDGREVPAVVAYLPTDAERGIGDDRRGGPAIWYGKPPAGNKLMTVAQHERILRQVLGGLADDQP